ncbi:MAG: DUF3012 domain-containing protein [Gammaproteobacteria bacterium]|jgi:hypothetical protein|nr:DUF3012 domain-containing protein [Gammaproteobacteria bacterium]
MSIIRVLSLLALLMALAACAPKIGSEAWCKAMDAKAKGDWTGKEAGAYAKHCVLGIKPAD